MDTLSRTTIKWHVIDRLTSAGLLNTPTNRGKILDDLRREAVASVVVTPDYLRFLDHEIQWNEYSIEMFG